MDREVFKRYFNRIILPNANALAELYGDLSIREGSEDIIFEEYLAQRTKMRELLRKLPAESLDRHKVGACMTNAIIHAHMLSQPKMDDDDNHQMTLYTFVRANEQLAFTSAVSILFAYIHEQAQRDSNQDIQNHFSSNIIVCFPIASRKGNDVISEIVNALFFARMSDTLSLPLLAVMYFYIENYHESTFAAPQEAAQE